MKTNETIIRVSCQLRPPPYDYILITISRHYTDRPQHFRQFHRQPTSPSLSRLSRVAYNLADATPTVGGENTTPITLEGCFGWTLDIRPYPLAD